MRINLIILMLAMTVISVSQPSYSETISEVKVIFADDDSEKPADEEPDCE
jgi:hypothetical protein